MPPVLIPLMCFGDFANLIGCVMVHMGWNGIGDNLVYWFAEFDCVIAMLEDGLDLEDPHIFCSALSACTLAALGFLGNGHANQVLVIVPVASSLVILDGISNQLSFRERFHVGVVCVHLLVEWNHGLLWREGDLQYMIVVEPVVMAWVVSGNGELVDSVIV